MLHKLHKSVLVQWLCVCMCTYMCLQFGTESSCFHYVRVVCHRGLSISLTSQSLSSIFSHVLESDIVPTSHSGLIKVGILGKFMSISYSFLEYAMSYWACFCYTWRWLGCREYRDKRVWQCSHRVRMCTHQPSFPFTFILLHAFCIYTLVMQIKIVLTISVSLLSHLLCRVYMHNTGNFSVLLRILQT